MAKRGWFDAEAFYAALDAQRQARRLTWKQVAKESGVTASTLTRMAQGKRPDVDRLAALSVWSGLKPDDFIRSGKAARQAEPLAMISTYLRSDPNLTHGAAVAIEAVLKATYEQLRNERADRSWDVGAASKRRPTR